MIVVADSSPLNYLIQIDKVAILPMLYATILVPSGVVEEMSKNQTPQDVRKWIAAPPPWLRIVRPSSIDPTLGVALGRGEREAISLAMNGHASLLLIDDLPGRRAAQQRKLAIIGTLTVLAEAHKQGLLDLPSAIDDLLALNFRASGPLIARVLSKASQTP